MHRVMFRQAFEVHNEFLSQLYPQVAAHLESLGVHVSFYGTRVSFRYVQVCHPHCAASSWFMTLFTNSLPFPCIVRVWDSLLSEVGHT